MVVDLDLVLSWLVIGFINLVRYVRKLVGLISICKEGEFKNDIL